MTVETYLPPLRRKVYASLLEWKRTSQGKTAMLIEGARRIGKTTIAAEFGRQEYNSYLVLNFDNMDDQIKDLFVHYRENLDYIFNLLQVRYKVSLVPRQSLIIFDEVQACPPARSLIKQLVADGRFDYLETGSLISLRKNVQDIIIPSEEEHILMYPLDFEEFCWAQNDYQTLPFLRRCYETLTPLGEMHREIMRRWRTYLLVGGMPQSVVAFGQSQDFARADAAKKSILSLYHQDIFKFGDGNEAKVSTIFDNIPSQLSKKSKRFQLSSISDSARSRTYEDAFIWLNESMMVNNCFSVSDPNIGLSLTANYSRVKVYLGDTGLLVSQVFADKPYLDNDIYRSILFDKLNINEGMIVENAVAQALRANGYRLYFYTTVDHDNRENDMEIDFLITQQRRLNPIEVKAGKYNQHISLDKFKDKFGRRVGRRYVLHTKDVSVNDDIVSLPLYMACCL